MPNTPTELCCLFFVISMKCLSVSYPVIWEENKKIKQIQTVQKKTNHNIDVNE